jgi:general secretion pathway protein G
MQVGDVGKPAQGAAGFTLIELLVVLAVLAILTAMIAPRYLDRVDQARETVLKEDLVGLRTAIDQYLRDKAHYPSALDDLVAQRYIRTIPVDPLTGRADWIVLPPKDGAAAVYDVRSAAVGRAADGTDYAHW